MRRCLSENVVREIQTDVSIQQQLEAEFDQLQQDRENIRTLFPNGDSKVGVFQPVEKVIYPRKFNRNEFFYLKVVLPVNLSRLIWNAQKIFHVDLRSPSKLNPVHVIEGVRELSKKLVIVCGEDRLSKEAQSNATLLFNVHVR